MRAAGPRARREVLGPERGEVGEGVRARGRSVAGPLDAPLDSSERAARGDSRVPRGPSKRLRVFAALERRVDRRVHEIDGAHVVVLARRDLAELDEHFGAMRRPRPRILVGVVD